MENLQVKISQKPGEILLNFDEMRQFLNERLEEYRSAVFSDDSIKYAKGHAAQLRKEQAAFKSRISEVKKEYMKPFESFKTQADNLVSLYDEPINFIDGQVKDYDRRRKEEKRKSIKSIYDKATMGITEEKKEFFSLDRIYNLKWENATYRIKEIEEEITNIVTKVMSEISVIKDMESDAEEKALALYKKNLTLQDAVAYINNYERQKAEILLKEQEYKRKQEEEKIRLHEREKIAAEQKAEEEKRKAVEAAKEEAAQEVIEALTPLESGETILYEYCFALTDDAKNKLEMYLDSVGIEWELI